MTLPAAGTMLPLSESAGPTTCKLATYCHIQQSFRVKYARMQLNAAAVRQLHSFNTPGESGNNKLLPHTCSLSSVAATDAVTRAQSPPAVTGLGANVQGVLSLLLLSTVAPPDAPIVGALMVAVTVPPSALLLKLGSWAMNLQRPNNDKRKASLVKLQLTHEVQLSLNYS